jgi:hypothetical protein
VGPDDRKTYDLFLSEKVLKIELIEDYTYFIGFLEYLPLMTGIKQQVNNN